MVHVPPRPAAGCGRTKWQSLQVTQTGFVLRDDACGQPPTHPLLQAQRGLWWHGQQKLSLALAHSPSANPLLPPQEPFGYGWARERPQDHSTAQGRLWGLRSTQSSSGLPPQTHKHLSVGSLAREPGLEVLWGCFSGVTTELWGEQRGCSGQTTHAGHCRNPLSAQTAQHRTPSCYGGSCSPIPTLISSPRLTERDTGVKQTARLSPLEETHGVIPGSVCPAQAGDTWQGLLLL